MRIVRNQANCYKSRIFRMTMPCSMTRRNYQMNAKDYMTLETKHACNKRGCIPVVLSRGEGVYLWDLDGKRYIDFSCGYSSLNQGHCHPRIIKALNKQASLLTVTSRAFFADRLGPFAKMMSQLFGYDRILPMNTGAEGRECAIKIARKWGYEVKNIPSGEAKIIFAEDNSWGRTLSTSCDPDNYEAIGPNKPGFEVIPFNDAVALEKALKDPKVAAFMTEPIQVEAGVIIPDDYYLETVRRLCTAYNVLWIADEVQTGLGRTGKLLAVDHEYVRPDILILGKALSGGTVPVSCVMANEAVMAVLPPGTHESTFGGNPLACAVAMEAVKVLLEEGMIENAASQGIRLRKGLSIMPKNVIGTRNRGLVAAIDIHDSAPAMEVCLELSRCGILTKPAEGQTIRLAPPLIISKEQLIDSICIIYKVLQSFVGRM